MVNIIKEELPIEEHLRKKLELICEFAKATPTIINGNVRKIDKTNLTYIEPNRIIIKDKIDKLKISKLNKDKYILSINMPFGKYLFLKKSNFFVFNKIRNKNNLIWNLIIPQ